MRAGEKIYSEASELGIFALDEMRPAMKRFFAALQGFFLPPASAPLFWRVMPYAVLGLLTIFVFVSSAYAWDYTNSTVFCGTSCHTMPPEYSAYQVSPHARVNCVECHIGREFVGNQFLRKAGDARHIIALLFTQYEYPIMAHEMRPAPEICERCHSPQKFSDDSLREIQTFASDVDNTPTSIYLALKTGGGSTREGLGRGIHWHIESQVMFYPTDKLEQTIPYVRVYNADGTYEEYVDLNATLPATPTLEAGLQRMDCITCHNRITHKVAMPEDAVDDLLAAGVIDRTIPEIRGKAVEVLRATYTSNAQANNGIAGLENFYQVAYPAFYQTETDRAKLTTAIEELQALYQRSVYIEQKSDWNSHSNNVGHKNFPGCFRCHDGEHLNADQQAIRLECNLCHSIPVVAGQGDFVANLEISRGPEPATHKNANWLVRHRDYFDRTCESCHTVGNPGGTDNSSFCSNSACHGSSWDFAALDAPELRAIAAAQLPVPTEAPLPPASERPTYNLHLQPLFARLCGECHGPEDPSLGLNLTTYAGIMAGSENGQVIVAGDPAASLLVKVQSDDHFTTFSLSELEMVRKWITVGAPAE